MKQKLLIGSIFVASFIVFTSLTSVVGVQTTKTICSPSSPLFTNRISVMLNKDPKEIESNYIGKGNTLNLFTNKKSYIRGWMDKAIRIFESNPSIIDKISAKIQKIPYVMDILNKQGINQNDLTKYISYIKNNPTILKQEFDQVQLNPGGEEIPSPQGLSTSNPIGCLVTVIALLPVIIILSVLIGTILIITCLNINGCLETLMQNIYDSILQQLIPP
jgi:hypothetical protein